MLAMEKQLGSSFSKTAKNMSNRTAVQISYGRVSFTELLTHLYKTDIFKNTFKLWLILKHKQESFFSMIIQVHVQKYQQIFKPMKCYLCQSYTPDSPGSWLLSFGLSLAYCRLSVRFRSGLVISECFFLLLICIICYARIVLGEATKFSFTPPFLLCSLFI